jgi:RNA 2',3'-cyclic 3'-phosphodiesterase
LPERLKSPRVRLFVALDLPDSVLDPLVEWRERALGSVQDARLVSRASLHVTLIFLGYQYERDVERIAGLCFGPSFDDRPGPFELRGIDVGAIPPRRPRLYALGLEDAGGALATWQQQLSDRLQAAGLYEPEKRPFWAHVTLVRGRRDRALARLDEPLDLPPELSAPFIPERATLYRSTLARSGAIYDPLARIELPRMR